MPDYNNDFDGLFDDSGFVSRSEAKKLARDAVQQTLSDIQIFGAQAQAGVQNAIREVTATHPDFEQKRPRMLAVLEQIPLLRDAVASAENNPTLAPSLPQIYEVVYRAAQAPADSNASATSEPSKLETGRPSDLSEDAMYAGALASQRISLSPENRKSIISNLERRGVLDVEF
jgi:hypothetical protein